MHAREFLRLPTPYFVPATQARTALEWHGMDMAAAAELEEALAERVGSASGFARFAVFIVLDFKAAVAITLPGRAVLAPCSAAGKPKAGLRTAHCAVEC